MAVYINNWNYHRTPLFTPRTPMKKSIAPSFVHTPWFWALVLGWTLLALPREAAAQTGTPYTLEDCLERAKDQSIQARQSLIAVQIEEENKKEARESILPNLNAGANWVNNWGLFIDPFTNVIQRQVRIQNYSANLSSSVTVFQGLANHNNIKRSEVNVRAAQKNYESAINDLMLQVSNAFVGVLFAQELLGVAEQQVQVTAIQVARVENEVQAGSRPQGDLFDIQAQLAREEQNQITTENNLRSAKLNLAQLMLMDDYENLKLSYPEIELETPGLLALSPQQIYAKATEYQPQIQSAQLNVESAQLGEKIAMANFYPSLRLSGSISSGASDRITDDFGKQFDENLGENLVLSMNIPLYNRRQVKSNVNRARLNSMNAELQLKQTKNQLMQQIQSAHNDALAAYNKYRADEKTVNSLETAFRYTEERYKVGLINAYEYNLSKNQLTAAESEMVRDKYDALFKLMVLDFYYNQKIEW